MEAKQDEELGTIFEVHDVPNECYTKLVEKGLGSIKLLSECTETDVDQLCTQLSLTLVDKLKVKQALKSVNIPRENMKYAIINNEEQSAIRDINESIQRIENMMISMNPSSTNYFEASLKFNREQIRSVFARIRSIIDAREQSLLNELQTNMQSERHHIEHLLQYRQFAKNTQSKCQQLIFDNDHLNRNRAIIDLRDACLSKYNQILQTQTKVKIISNDHCISSIQTQVTDVIEIKKTPFDAKRNSDENDQYLHSESNDENVNTSNSWSRSETVQSKPFGSFQPWQPHKEQLTTNDDSAKLKANEDEHNGLEFTCKPLIELKEQSVPSGHAGEALLTQIGVNKLYYFGRDVIGDKGEWKLRAANTNLEFYKNELTNKIRLVCRERGTAKLRANHYISGADMAGLEKKSEKLIVWSAFDVSIEENRERNAPSLFLAKFDDANHCETFFEYFQECQI